MMHAGKPSTRPLKTAQPLLVACLAVLLAVGAAFAAGETVFVTVKKVAIRKDRQFYAPTVAAAAFRDRFVVLARQGDWVRVRFGAIEGWVHVSATAARTVSVSAMEATAGVSQDDVAHATKGFDDAVEREYRKGKPGADFAAVDRMERTSVPVKTLAEFRQAGNLHPREPRR